MYTKPVQSPGFLQAGAMPEYWDYLTARENQRQVISWTVLAVTLPAAGAFLWWLSEKGYNNVAPYRVSSKAPDFGLLPCIAP